MKKSPDPWITFCPDCGAAPRVWAYEKKVSLSCNGTYTGDHSPVRVEATGRSLDSAFRAAREIWVAMATGRKG